MRESPLPRGFCATLGEGRAGLEDTTGPLVSLLTLPGEGVGLGPPTIGDSTPGESLGRVDANLLPVALSFTLSGLKPKRPAPPEPLGGFCLAAGSGERGRVVAFLIPPMGGGGGGGGAPVHMNDTNVTMNEESCD